MRCPSCSRPIADRSLSCPECGARLPDPPTATRARPPGGSGAEQSPLLPERPHFLPGAVVDGRYRLVSLLGRGGMGEVYRADDLKLGQAVALKFLPRALASEPHRLARFLSEVRLARQVSHPGVCRVYDVGEVDGQHYISMEFVDGEDLASLLRRIGRLPGDKALQVARQLCAGLAAAHEQGILHRDLKPANVMIDGRGRARIADFGLAELASGVENADVRSGTPLYMAPEQLAGREVSVRSDVYALGLVLYEAFTGRRPFEASDGADLLRLRTESRAAPPSSVSENLDPAVERAILQCLEADPRNRPASALAVAAALPGGDPLAEVLAAGETPSPEMVAAAGPEGGLPPGSALGALAVVVLGIAAYAWVNEGSVYDRLPLVKSAEALQENARAITARLGYAEVPGDSVGRFRMDYEEFLQLTRERGPTAAWDSLEEPGQLVLGFLYRQSPGRLAPRGPEGEVDHADPPPGPGDVTMTLDLQGRLRYLRVVPSRVAVEGQEGGAPDWREVFAAAGLEMDRFAAEEPRVRPAVYADTRAAWTGSLPGPVERPVRIEAAACGGRAVYFETIVSSSPLWSLTTDAEVPDNDALLVASLVLLVTLVALVVAGALVLAVRNLRTGRGDRRGAFRIAAAVAILRMLDWLVTGHHVAGDEELGLLLVALVGSLALGLFWYVAYVALEPYLRRVRPEALVSWSRLLGGRLRDPSVGRDVLRGFAAWIGVMALLAGVYTVGAGLGFAAPTPDASPLTVLRGGRYAVGELFGVVRLNGQIAFFYAMFYLLCRTLFRRAGLAAAAFIAAIGTLAALPFLGLAPGHGSPGLLLVSVLWGATVAGGILAIFLRLGLLSLLAAMVLSGLLTTYPIALNPEAPHFSAFLVGPLVAIAVAAWAFRTSLAGRPLFDERLLGEKRPPA